MRHILAYWVIGCIVIGLMIGKTYERCPSQEVSASGTVMQIAIWPTFIAAAVTAPKDLKYECKTKGEG